MNSQDCSGLFILYYLGFQNLQKPSSYPLPTVFVYSAEENSSDVFSDIKRLGWNPLVKWTNEMWGSHRLTLYGNFAPPTKGVPLLPRFSKQLVHPAYDEFPACCGLTFSIDRSSIAPKPPSPRLPHLFWSSHTFSRRSVQRKLLFYNDKYSLWLLKGGSDAEFCK